MEALLCYCKIEVNKSGNDNQSKEEASYKDISAKDLEKELMREVSCIAFLHT